MASNQNLALKTPKRLEALFLTWSGDQLTVRAAYSRQGASGSRGLGWEQPLVMCLRAAWLHQLQLWDLDDGITLVDQPSLCPLPKTFTPPPNWHCLLEMPDIDLPLELHILPHVSGEF